MTSEVQTEKEELPSHVHPEVHESDMGTHIDTLEKKRSRCYAILPVAQNQKTFPGLLKVTPERP